MGVKPIPDGYSTVTPYLIIKGAANALEYYKMAFDAQEIMRMPGPDGNIAHAEVQIGTSRVMLADESPQMGHKSPLTLGGSGTSLMLYVTDVDDTFQRAVSGGGKVTDPFGHQWTVATHVEDVAPDEMKRRMDETMKAAPR
jgi:PhnB protein